MRYSLAHPSNQPGREQRAAGEEGQVSNAEFGPGTYRDPGVLGAGPGGPAQASGTLGIRDAAA